MPLAEYFGRRLKELRESAGLTQKQLAEKAGLSQRAISQWEQEDREPSWSMVLALAEALGVDCNTFAEPPSGNTEPRGPGRPAKAASADQGEQEASKPQRKLSGEKTAARGQGRKKKGT